jgi:hypothetical protein
MPQAPSMIGPENNKRPLFAVPVASDDVRCNALVCFLLFSGNERERTMCHILPYE